ncbi:MAG: electron transport complex subunit RsxG [Oceanospirillaceae bacterium]|nr:electron transport complex subunit RsxG [Oceanospirillaceae bacterium]MCP5334104.1 electron transport complex subunit RsxG [Oceanospirillaceae bacterium]MCP5351260.1 electron transport complex subunit RsxG [Oceanospirillaceae bacterium]
MQELFSAIRRNALGLAIFAALTAGAIAVTQVLTQQRINDNMAAAQAKALYQLVPASEVDNDLLHDTLDLHGPAAAKQFHLNLLGPIKDDAVAYLARKNGQIHTVILPITAPDGYTQEIRLLVGIRADGSLSGVRVVEHKETPGLGDKIELKKSPWLLGFSDKSLLNPEIEHWKVKKDGGDFDQFTGATITPRAVVLAVRRSLEFFDKHKDALLNAKAAE